MSPIASKTIHVLLAELIAGTPEMLPKTSPFSAKKLENSTSCQLGKVQITKRKEKKSKLNKNYQ